MQRCGKFLELSTLSHGQAAVERKFSVNGELLVENLQENILVVSCFVYISVKSDANHFSELSFTPRLKRNVRAARMRYLEEQRKLHKAKKRKTVEDEICEVKCKRKLLNKSIQARSLEADKLATEAEVKHNFALQAKARSITLVQYLNCLCSIMTFC